MFEIRPVTDLRNKFTDISKQVHENGQPVFLTKNGYGDMVVMSMETFSKLNMDNIISEKLQQAVREARSTDERLDFDEVSKEMRGDLIEKLQNKANPNRNDIAWLI